MLLHPSKNDGCGFVAIKVRKDNLMYLFYNEKYAFCVDPFSPKTILHAAGCDFDKLCYSESEILSLKKTRNRKILYVLTTHGHYDHNGGNDELKRLCPEIIFIQHDNLSSSKDDSINNQNPSVNNNENIPSINDGLLSPFLIRPIYTPCHTLDSYCYAISINGGKTYYCVLTGDFIFKLGCGKFFEGNPEMFCRSLNTLLDILDDDCLMLYGHDYYETNRRFTEQFYRVDGVDDMFLSVGMEKKFNPFFKLALGDREIIDQNGSIYDCIGTLRRMKDDFQS